MTRLAALFGTCCGLMLAAGMRPAEGSILLDRSWINEFHYDNVGADVGEFVEVVVPEWFLDLSEVRVSLYNGGTGRVYSGPLALDAFDVGETVGGFTIYSTLVSMQNGSRDGIALEHAGQLLQFLSYEGELTAIDGIAASVTSVDVGVSETTSTPVGMSLQLSGVGDRSSHFSWNGPSAASRGRVNAGQTFQSAGHAVPEPSTLMLWCVLFMITPFFRPVVSPNDPAHPLV